MAATTLPPILQQIEAQLGVLPGKTLSTSEVESKHHEMQQIFTAAMEQIAAHKATLQQGTTTANQEARFSAALPLTQTEDRLTHAFRRYNDTLLTHYPTAKIAYGRACVGPKTPCPTPISGCTSMREIRGDGNCFLSAFTTRLLETFATQRCLDILMNLTTRDGLDLPELKEGIMQKLLTLFSDPSQIETFLQNNENILPFISYFRHITAKEILQNTSQFEVVLRADLEQVYQVASASTQPLDTLVQQHIIPMGIDFSHSMITALCQKINFPIKIIDPKLGAPTGIDILDGQEAKAIFCRNGEHYYVLYLPEVAPPPLEIIATCLPPPGCLLTIRGRGDGLSWNQGIALIDAGNATWGLPLGLKLAPQTEYKCLLNDKIYEEGHNHIVPEAGIITISPFFLLSIQITVIYPASELTNLFIRGEGGEGLNWERGIALQRISPDTWIYDARNILSHLTYKILINDTIWQQGPNLQITRGKREQITPFF